MRKKYLLLLFAAFIIFSGVYIIGAGVQQNSAAAESPEDLIRFHVIANSDKPGDQALKREVRDAILAEMGEEFGQVDNSENAEELAASKLDKMEEIAREIILSNGKDYGVKAEIGNFDFPAKAYGTFSLPAGEYRAVRVVIGEGSGENWWCVLFPPLCFVDISSNADGGPPAARKANSEKDVERVMEEYDEDKLADEAPETETDDPEVEVKLKLLEVFSESKDGFVAENGSSKR